MCSLNDWRAQHPSEDIDPLTGHDHRKLLPSYRAKMVTLFERTFRLSSSTCLLMIVRPHVSLSSPVKPRILPDR